tara:strand:+ start:1011 stop:1832 length:822 start_codon:yes stop_codon:yes gene_type:complete
VRSTTPRVATRAIKALAILTLVIGTIVLCGATVLFVMLSGDIGYDKPVTAAGWLEEIAEAASAKSAAPAILSMTLIVVCVIIAITIWRRSVEWLAAGLVCGVLLSGSLVIVAWGDDNVDRLTEMATSAIGNTPAILPPGGTTPAPDPLTVTQARDETTRMLRATIEASAPPLRTPEDVPVTVHQTPVSAVPCGEAGARLTVDLAFSTGDNAASLTHILAAWDTAGYLPDRAMQVDLRYSTALPIERMSIRDSTSVDGMIHLTLESACAVAATP